jgi:hypothetical protein
MRDVENEEDEEETILSELELGDGELCGTRFSFVGNDCGSRI